MKALRFSKFGPPSVLAIEEIPKPEAGHGGALIQVKAAAINPSDLKNVSGFFPGTTLPRTPGRDFSGIVVEGQKYKGKEVWSSGPGPWHPSRRRTCRVRPATAQKPVFSRL